jgi:cyclohexanone monooxygenase
MGFVQSALTPNFPHLLNEQAKHIAYVVGRAREKGITAVEATREAESEWVATIERLARLGERFFRECTPGYYNGEGKTEQRNGLIANSYGGGPIEFFKVLKEWRDEGGLRGLELS